VRLGQTAANVVDLAVGDEALYTLDVVEGAVRAFALDALDQQPTPGTLLATRGTPVGLLGRALETPVAIEYLPDVAGQGGSLAIVDQARDVVQVVADRQLSLREVPTSTSWLSLGALGAGSAGELLFLDSRAHQLLAYPNVDQPVLDPPSVVADGLSARGLAFERVAQVVSTADGLVLRLDDGSLQRLDPHSGRVPLAIPPGDDAGSVVTAIASDRAGGLYLADVANGRVLQTTGRGLVVREFRHPALASVRAMDATRDGRQLYALVDAGVLVVDLPDV
jgi:hypothetical protein